MDTNSSPTISLPFGFRFFCITRDIKLFATMKPRRYLLCTTVVLLLAGLSSVSSLQEQTPAELTTTPSSSETTTIAADATIAPPTTTTTTASPTGTNNPANTTTKKPTAKPATTSTKPPVVNCLANCTCRNERELICEDLELTQLPKLEPKSSFVRISFARNNIEELDFRLLRNAEKLEYLDLSENKIKTVVQPRKFSTGGSTGQLRELYLNDNMLESMSDLNSWLMPNLELLDVSRNPIKQLWLGPADSRPALSRLFASEMRLSKLDDQALVAAPRLTFLKLFRAQGGLVHLLLDNLAFANNTQLETIDLSRNRLLEVPVALRSAKSLKRLILNDNLMTSLRMADFVQLTNLEHLELQRCTLLRSVDANAFGELTNLSTLVIASNPRLSHFSPEAFLPVNQIMKGKKFEKTTNRLKLIDLSSNNLTTLAKINQESLIIEQLRLANNSLDCTCELEWLVKMPNLSQQQPIHCATPRKYHDLELSHFFQVHECSGEDSTLQRCVMALCILLLLLVTIAVFVQKTDLCRRLRWRDQYGTIYYTKASFPQEQL